MTAPVNFDRIQAFHTKTTPDNHAQSRTNADTASRPLVRTTSTDEAVEAEQLLTSGDHTATHSTATPLETPKQAEAHLARVIQLFGQRPAAAVAAVNPTLDNQIATLLLSRPD